MKTGIVSFSLFGTDPDDIYHEGAVKQSVLYKKFKPDWDLWFYVGASVPNETLQRISDANPRASIEFVDEPEDLSATWWRYRALKVAKTDFVLFRDTDSRLSNREVDAVDEWLSQDVLPVHMMRDHPYHGVHLLAGLLGVQRSAYGMFDLPDRLSTNHYQCDQEALSKYIWSVAKKKTMVHIGCYHLYEKPRQRRPFRSPRDGSFVGEGFYGDGRPRFPDHTELVEPDSEFLEHQLIFPEEYRVPTKNPRAILPGRS